MQIDLLTYCGSKATAIRIIKKLWPKSVVQDDCVYPNKETLDEAIVRSGTSHINFVSLTEKPEMGVATPRNQVTVNFTGIYSNYGRSEFVRRFVSRT